MAGINPFYAGINPFYAVHCWLSTAHSHDGSKQREKVVVVVTEQTMVSPWRAHGE